MANILALGGANPGRQTKRTPLWTERFWQGLYTNRSPLRDAGSTHLESKFYGARGDGLLDGANVEITQRLTIARRPGSSIYNNQTWNNPNCFYEFREFNANEEQIKVMIDQANALYNGTGPSTQIPIWQKSPGSGQSYMQSVGNTLFWGDGIDRKKWVNTLQSRIPYVNPTIPASPINPYNFASFQLGTFIVDPNGNAQQLIGTVLQLSSFYILNNTIVLSLIRSQSSIYGTIYYPLASEIAVPGEQMFCPPGSQLATVLGAGVDGVTITISAIVGGVYQATVSNSGIGYTFGDIIPIDQPGQPGSMGGSVIVTGTDGSGRVTSVNVNTIGDGYLTANNLPTTGGTGTGLTLNIVSNGEEIACIYSYGGGTVTSGSPGTPAGTGYSFGDLLEPLENSEPASTGAVFFVSSTGGGGSVTGVTFIQGGVGYVSSSNLPTTTNGPGFGATINIVVGNPSSYPVTSTSDILHIFEGGNPISDSYPNSAPEIVWATAKGAETIDGSALWVNRGPAVDNGLVYNWGIIGGTTSPSIVVNGAIAAWQPNTYYNRWQIIIDSNGNVQQLTYGGLSGSSVSWSAGLGDTTTDGAARWVLIQLGPLAWAPSTSFPAGSIVEATAGGTTCVFQRQAASGIQYQGTNFPVYLWQCGSESGADIAAAGGWNNGSNVPMTYPQSLATATYSGTSSGLYFFSDGSVSVETAPVDGKGQTGSLATLFSASANYTIAALPNLVIPAAGTYTFTVGHQGGFFWGIGSGSISLDITGIEVQGGVLNVKCEESLAAILTVGVSLTFSGVTKAAFLNGISVTVSSIQDNTFSATYSHANYSFTTDTGNATSSAGLTPNKISQTSSTTAGNTVSPWNNPYNFSTGSPIQGYPIMGSSYGSAGNHYITDTIKVNFPSAGVYPCEIQYGFWFHSLDPSRPALPTVSPTLPGGQDYCFYMVYSPPGSSLKYNILPEDSATSSATVPVWPAFTTAGAPNYPSVTETSGNYTWQNLGPVSSFAWNPTTNYTTQTYIIDTNSYKQIPFEAGISGSTVPVFSQTLYGITFDLPNLVWMNGGFIGNTPTGTISTFNGGWKYAVALVNTLDDTVSNASLVSVSTGNFFSGTGVFVSGGLPAYIDPQADYVAIFRTDDGGATYYLIPPTQSENGNTEYTIPLAQYLSQGFVDSTPDSGLFTQFQAPLAGENTPPPKGLINCTYALSRIFGSVGNTVYWSTGPDTPIGNGFNGFSPKNYAEFPSLVKRMVPVNSGTIVFTVSDVYLLEGNGTAQSPITPLPFLQKLGLLSYNALTVNGSVIYFMTTDKQVVELNPHSGVSEVGHPIADLLSQLSPSSSYLTWHVDGSFDQALFVADGVNSWYKMLPTPAPETGLTWCPKATIQAGCRAVQSIETTPGNIQLLMGPSGTGPILFRDNSLFADNGVVYPAFFRLGSLVFAQPGQLAEIEFITTDSMAIGTPLTMGVLLGEIEGDFEVLTEYTSDPPQLPPSESLYNQRFYLSQTKEPAVCRHMQMTITWPAENYQNEIISLTPYGGFDQES